MKRTNGVVVVHLIWHFGSLLLGENNSKRILTCHVRIQYGTRKNMSGPDTGEGTMMTITSGNPEAPIVLIQMVDDHDLDGMESEISEIRKLAETEFYHIAFKVRNWNKDLSPWLSPAVFGRESFGDGAADTLSEVLKYCTDRDKTYFIGGYSLAGLFALWAAYQTDVFKGVAAASPSVWFPGFVEYMRENRIRTDSVYLSLGDREEKTRNTVMAAVGVKIREAYTLLKDQGINTTLEWNQGNHFRDADIRTAKAYAWLMKK